jgi:hypothetical protein
MLVIVQTLTMNSNLANGIILNQESANKVVRKCRDKDNDCYECKPITKYTKTEKKNRTSNFADYSTTKIYKGPACGRSCSD